MTEQYMLHASTIRRLLRNEPLADTNISKGYAGFDDQIGDHSTGDLLKVSILVKAEPADADKGAASALR